MTRVVGLTVLSILISFIAVPCSRAQPHVMPREQTLSRSVDSGQELRVFTYARWSPTCQQRNPPRIEIRTQPEHGRVELRTGPATVSHIREGEADCTGKTFDGLGVWYRPTPGYHGTDTFSWDVIDVRGTSHDTAVVEVR
jgi:hypothetical protein